MSYQTLEQLEEYKRRNALNDMHLSQRLGVYYNYLFRWRRSGRIIGIYKKVVDDFLKRERENGKF